MIQKINRDTEVKVILFFVGAISLVGFSVQDGSAVGPEGSMYVASNFGKTISVIDTKTNTVGNTIVVSNHPVAMAFDTAHNRMYVVNSDDKVSVIDVKTDTVIKTIPLAHVGHESAIAFDTAHKRMYVVLSDDDSVGVIDTNTNTVVGSPIEVGNFPQGIAFDSVHNRMYVTSPFAASVSVIDTNTNTVVGSPIPLPTEITDQAFGITFDEKLRRMYVGTTRDAGNDWIVAIDTDTNSVFFSYPVKEGPLSVAFDSIHRRVYALNAFATDSISVIATNDNTVIGEPIPVSFNSRDIAFDPIHRRVYVTNGFDDSVSVFDTNTHNVIGSPLFVGEEPEAIAFAPPLTTTNVFGPTLP